MSLSEEELHKLVEKWKERQVHYENVAEKHRNNAHTYAKFTYKAMATRDCWKELLTLLKSQEDGRDS
jgi:hypothetical protein